MLFCFFLFVFCFLGILLYSVHFTHLLLLLELCLLSIYFYVSFSFFCSYGLFFCFTFLLVMVCLGGFSISLLVSLSRCFGRDFWVNSYVF